MLKIQNRFHQNNTQISQDDHYVSQSKNDIANFGSLYDKYYISIFRFIFNRVNNIDEAEDICSQVFLKAMQNIDKYESKGLPFGAWLFRIASNEVMQYFRKVKKELLIEVDSEQVSKVAQDLETDSNYEEWLPSLAKAMESLSEDEVSLIQYRYFDNLSFKETAEILGMSENNAKVKLFRLLGKLKSKLSKKQSPNQRKS